MPQAGVEGPVAVQQVLEEEIEERLADIDKKSKTQLAVTILTYGAAAVSLVVAGLYAYGEIDEKFKRLEDDVLSYENRLEQLSRERRILVRENEELSRQVSQVLEETMPKVEEELAEIRLEANRSFEERRKKLEKILASVRNLSEEKGRSSVSRWLEVESRLEEVRSSLSNEIKALSREDKRLEGDLRKQLEDQARSFSGEFLVRDNTKFWAYLPGIGLCVKVEGLDRDRVERVRFAEPGADADPERPGCGEVQPSDVVEEFEDFGLGKDVRFGWGEQKLEVRLQSIVYMSATVKSDLVVLRVEKASQLRGQSISILIALRPRHGCYLISPECSDHGFRN